MSPPPARFMDGKAALIEWTTPSQLTFLRRREHQNYHNSFLLTMVDGIVTVTAPPYMTLSNSDDSMSSSTVGSDIPAEQMRREIGPSTWMQRAKQGRTRDATSLPQSSRARQLFLPAQPGLQRRPEKTAQ